MTSTSIVGLPRESRISRASTSVDQRVHAFAPDPTAAFRAFAFGLASLGGRSWRTAIPGQLATLEELERGAAAGRDVGELAGQPLLLDRRHAVAAADDDRDPGLRPVGEIAGDRDRAVGERRDLEHAERAVPEHGLRAGQGFLDRGPALLAEIDDVPRGGELVRPDGLVLRAAGDLLGDHDVDRQDHLHAPLLGEREQPPGVVDAIVLRQALADGLALGEEERVRHPAAEDEHVDLRQEVLDHVDLVADLRPAEDRRERPLRVLEELAEHVDLALHQEPGVGGQDPGDPDGRGVRAMGGPERVVHVDVGVGRERPGRRPGRSSPPPRGTGGSRGGSPRPGASA